MDIILNDFSLSGQFKDRDEFLTSMQENILPILSFAKQRNQKIFKRYDSYNNRVTDNESLQDLLRSKNDATITLFKSYLANLITDEPYWEDNLATDIQINYQCHDDYRTGENSIFPNCLSEAYERSGLLLSFKHEHFQQQALTFIKNSGSVIIMNCFEKQSYLYHLVKQKQICFCDYMGQIVLPLAPLATIIFLQENHKYHAASVFDDLMQEDMDTIQNDLIMMINLVSIGQVSRFSKEMVEEPFKEFRTTISHKRELRLFYLREQNQFIFLNGLIKKTEKTPLRAKEKARQLVKSYFDSRNNKS